MLHNHRTAMLPTVIENRRYHRPPPSGRLWTSRKLMVLLVVLVITCFNIYFKDLRKQKSLKATQPPNLPSMLNMPMDNVAGEVLSDWVDTRDEFEMNGVGRKSLNQAVDQGIHLQEASSHSKEDSLETSTILTTIIDNEPMDTDEFENNPDELVKPKTNRSAIKTLNQFVDNYNVYRVRTILQAVHIPIYLPSERKPKTSTTTDTTIPQAMPPKQKVEPSKTKTKTKSKTSKNKSKTLSGNKTSTIEPIKHTKDNKTKNRIPSPHILPKAPMIIPLLASKKNDCINPAFEEFPADLFGHWARAHGFIIVHILVVCYMFYCLAVVCDHYFLPSLEQCSQRLNLSQDVAGATFMAAGSSAPELFTAILGVFIAKGDVGTGTIVGSAVFNILFVIGLCSLYTVSTQLNWWPVARDSTYYTFTVLVLILFIYDGEVTVIESFFLLVLYGVYILIMNYNIELRDRVQALWQTYFPSTGDVDKNFDELDGQKPGAIALNESVGGYGAINSNNNNGNPFTNEPVVQNPFVVRMPKVTVFEAANQVIIKYKRLFKPKTRFRHAVYLVILRARKAHGQDMSHRMSKIELDQTYWRQLPDLNTEGVLACLKWAVVAPLQASLYYTIPDCKQKPHLFLVTFFASISWTAFFSYIMVWMVTLIGFTFGIPDSIMGITFLAAGTSVPDAYASIHVAKLGQADMAVSNSIGSNVFDILVGLALPWFIETAIVSPGEVSTINSQGLIYAVVLLFLSLLMTIFLFHRYHWTLNPQLGRALLITYAVFVIICSALEFNMFGYVNPPICGE